MPYYLYFKQDVLDVKPKVVEHVDLASDGSVSLIVAPVQEWVIC